MWKKNLSFVPVLAALALIAAGCAGQTPAELLSQAQKAEAAGQPRTAQIHLKNLLRQDPDNAAARSLLGQVSLQLGDAPSSEANFRRALALGADAKAIQIPLVRVLISEGKFDDALKQIEAGPKFGGQNQVALLNLKAVALQALKKPKEAEAAYEAALAIDPDSLATKSGLAAFRVEQRQYKEARDLVVAVLEKQADFSPALLVRGRLEMLGGRLGDAEATFRHVIETEGEKGKDYFAASSQLVNILLAEGSVDKASEAADKLIAAYPRHPIAIVLKASVEVKQGQLDSARQRLETLVAALPTYSPANRLLGTINAEQGRAQQAQMYLQSALTQNPRDGLAMLRLAALHLKQGDVDAAKKQLADAVKPVQTKSAAVLFALGGRASVEAHQQDLATQFFEQSARSLTGDPQELVAVSQVFAASGNVAGAQGLLQNASDAKGDKAWMATYMLALTQLQQKDVKSARVTADSLVKQQPKAPWALNLRGLVEILSKDLKAARQDYTAALDLDSKYLPALLNLARVDLLENKPDQAEADYRKVLAADPKQAAALIGLAQLALAKKDYKQAQQWLDKAPQSVQRLKLEGALAVAQGRADDAADDFAKLFSVQPTSEVAVQAFATAQKAKRPNPESPLFAWIAEHPRDARVNFVLGGLALQKGDHDEAIKRYEAVVAAAPKQAEALNNLAWLYGQKGDARAIEVGKRAHEAAPDNPAIADTLGWLETQQGDAKSALPLLEQSRKALPENASIQYHWAAALAKTGSKDQAAAVLRKLLAGDAQFDGRSDAEQLLKTLQ